MASDSIYSKYTLHCKHVMSKFEIGVMLAKSLWGELPSVEHEQAAVLKMSQIKSMPWSWCYRFSGAMIPSKASQGVICCDLGLRAFNTCPEISQAVPTGCARNGLNNAKPTFAGSSEVGSKEASEYNLAKGCCGTSIGTILGLPSPWSNFRHTSSLARSYDKASSESNYCLCTKGACDPLPHLPWTAVAAQPALPRILAAVPKEQWPSCKM